MAFQPPMVRELDRAEIDRVLHRNGAGRIAYVLEQRVVVEPVHFAVSNGCIYARTAHGARLRTVQHDGPVTFHVDEIDGVFLWRSVVAHGAVAVLSLDPSPQEKAQWDEGLDALQRLEPAGSLTDDGMMRRGTAFRIRLDEVDGRSCGDVRDAARGPGMGVDVTRMHSSSRGDGGLGSLRP